MSIPGIPRLVVPLVTIALGAALASCASRGADDASPPDTSAIGAVVVWTDTAAAALPPASAPPPSLLSPLADTIAQRLVFAPVIENWFAASSRGKRLVVDLGRLDIDLKKDSARFLAFRQAAGARSPVPIGSVLRLRGPWGSLDAPVTGFDAVAGRIVATLGLPPDLDSLAAGTEPLVASAERIAGARSGNAASSASSCDRTSDGNWDARLTGAARAVEAELRAGEQPAYPRLAASVKSRVSTITGCFGAARGMVAVTLYAGDYEWVRERVLLVSESGVKRLVVRDLRFRAHELLHALDADGDGVDDVAARAWTPRGGGLVVLRLAGGEQLERLASGFAYER
ncbi:MAG: hypothetical protein ABIZ91_01040 [Gemmatimonadaceae bacterium]